MTMDDATTDAESDRPDPLREHLYALVSALAAHDGLLVALDFDGTLAAIADDPDAARIPDATRQAVAALAAEPSVEVAVVSGRELADVRERVGVPDLSYAGNHGLELHTDEYVAHPEARAAQRTVAAAVDDLAADLADVAGAAVEDKGLTATVHFRRVADEHVPAVTDAVESLVGAREDLRLTTGKAVLELRPDVEWDKGAAVRRLEADLVPAGEDWLPMYVGDDTTDEAAFAVLADRGIAVKVGADPATEAPYRVADPEAVRALLDWLGTYGPAFLSGEPGDAPTDPP
ncbi:trehalose-phosphatase [Halorussus halobius]|uniref:trehalose-phosphatase n=1 Tax=Halorussus halobius TaxID=1710537 RepID=UPI001FCE41A5|nr:trehalose-phosphatase [Halorussus halobius]